MSREPELRLAKDDADLRQSDREDQFEALPQFAGRSVDYYRHAFQRIERNAFALSNKAALLLGPIWAASRGLWVSFWLLGAVELVLAILIGQALFQGNLGARLYTCIAIMMIARLLFSMLSNRAYFNQYQRWRADNAIPSGLSYQRLAAGTAMILLIYSLCIYRFIFGNIDYINKFPTNPYLHRLFSSSIDGAVNWLVVEMRTAFELVTWTIRSILNLLDTIFISTPWPVTGFLFVLIAWRVAGRRVGIFTAFALAYVAFFGYWEKAMSTFSLVGASLAICIPLGIPFGIWCGKRPTVYRRIQPTLDVMQTMPAFVYLIPAVALFSIGKPPGVVATVIFAMPPLIRLTALGVSQVPATVKEAAVAFGASPSQLLFKVELPLAIPSIMTGLNQTIMMSLSMVVISALIGAGGLGYDIVFALNHVDAGGGILAGIAVALCAMILDRIVQGSGLAKKAQ